MLATPTTGLAHVKDGRLKAMVTTLSKRSSLLADVPTISATYSGFSLASWNGFLVPAKTPRGIIEKLARHVIAAAKDPGNVAQLTALGIEPNGTTPQEFRAQIEREQPQFDGAIKAANKGLKKNEAFKKGPGPGKIAPENFERMLAMPSEQRERLLEKLPPGQQNNLRKRFAQFDSLPPEEKARRLEMWRRLESLSPEKREVLTRQMQAFNALPEEQRVLMRRAINNLSRMDPEERQLRLESRAFQSRFSPAERQMISDLAGYPLPGR